jgi:hypothetical protein
LLYVNLNISVSPFCLFDVLITCVLYLCCYHHRTAPVTFASEYDGKNSFFIGSICCWHQQKKRFRFEKFRIPFGRSVVLLFERRKDVYAARAQTFADALMAAKYEDIPDSKGMKVLRNVTDLETGEKSSIVVRSVTPLFWNACIDLVDTPDKRYRVAALGTPGIGKTKSTPILIRILLERKITVVYHIRTLKETGWYYEFVPNKTNKNITANIYSEARKLPTIPSLENQSTYYIVDPGKTKDSCDPPDDFLPKSILVTSPDEGHWGSAFDKRRDNVLGCFKIYPVWSLEELVLARKEFEGELAEDVIKERYRIFGGVPRSIFASIQDLVRILEKQDSAILAISETQAKAIALGRMDVLGDFGPNAAKGAVIGFNATRKDFEMTDKEVFLLSPAIAEKVYSMHIRTLWNTMINNEPAIQRTLFEPYIRSLLTRSKNALSLETRMIGSKESHPKIFPICKSIKLLSKVTKQELQQPLVLLHFLNLNYPLIDCIYNSGTGGINAIQITTGKTHSMSNKQIQDLHEAVGIERKLNLFYFVPSNNYLKFRTTKGSVRKQNYVNSNFEAYIVSVPDPNDADVEFGNKENVSKGSGKKKTSGEKKNARKKKASGEKKTSGKAKTKGEKKTRGKTKTKGEKKTRGKTKTSGKNETSGEKK